MEDSTRRVSPERGDVPHGAADLGEGDLVGRILASMEATEQMSSVSHPVSSRVASSSDTLTDSSSVMAGTSGGSSVSQTDKGKGPARVMSGVTAKNRMVRQSKASTAVEMQTQTEGVIVVSVEEWRAMSSRAKESMVRSDASVQSVGMMSESSKASTSQGGGGESADEISTRVVTDRDIEAGLYPYVRSRCGVVFANQTDCPLHWTDHGAAAQFQCRRCHEC